MIVEVKKIGECKVSFDDESYTGKTKEEIQKIIDNFSIFVIGCVQKKKTA